jgi:hypothetical protein
MASKKGQMFIVTMVFLIALIFSVQQILLYYNVMDLSSPPQTTDAYMMENIGSIFQTALDSSNSCEEARMNVMELENLITKSIRGGYSIDILGDIECSPAGEWPPPPELTILVTVTGETSETKAEFELYYGGPPIPLIFIDPEEQTKSAGPVNIDVSISDIENLYGFQFDLTYELGVDVCECDLNDDGKCDMLDQLIFGEDWGRTDCGTPPGSGNPPNDCECDLNKDGKCDMLDQLIFGEDWGRTDCNEPRILQFQDISEGTFLSDGGPTFWIEPDTGTPGLLKNTACVRMGPVGGLDGDGVLASITFSIVGPGQSQINLENVILTDPGGNKISPFNIKGGTVNIN